MHLDKSAPLNIREGQEKKRATQMLELFRSGITETPDTIGYHGTSTEALDVLLKTGRLPGQTHSETPELQHTKGDLFIAPVLKNIPSRWFRQQFIDQPLTIEDVQIYAENISKRHYVLDKLGIPLDTDIALSAVMDFSEFGAEAVLDGTAPLSDEIYEFIRSVGTERFTTLMQEAESRRGVVLSIRKSALEKYGFGVGDKGIPNIIVEDAKLRTGSDGLSLDDIGGMQASGDDGKDFVRRLQQISG